MHLKKNTSIWLAMGTLVVFFAIGIFSLKGQNAGFQNTSIARNDTPQPALLATAVNNQEQSPLPASITAEPQQAAVRLNRFERSETKDGKLVWQVRAAQGDYFPAEHRTQLHGPELTFHRPNGGLVELRSKEAQVFIDGVTLTRADLQGNVRLVQDNRTTIATETASFDRTKNIVTAPGAVTITTPQGQVTGASLSANIDTQIFELHGDVETVILPRKAKS